MNLKFWRTKKTHTPCSLLTDTATDLPYVSDWNDSLDAAILRHLYRHVARLRREGFTPSHWTIGPRWYQQLRSARFEDGHLLVAPLPDRDGGVRIFGYPITVIPGATLPCLIPVTRKEP